MSNTIYFSYDGIHSSIYNLELADFDESSHTEVVVLTPVLNTVKPNKQHRIFHNGISYDEINQRTYSMLSKSPLDTATIREILTWLVGRDSFKKFEIHQNDLNDYYYLCVFTNASLIYINGLCHGVSLNANFDSHYIYGEPTTISVTGTGSAVEMAIYNNSDIIDNYTYPLVSFTHTAQTTSGDDTFDISIINKTDDINREFKFSGLMANNAVTVDNELCMIRSATNEETLSKFSKNWLRLNRGRNVLEIKITGTVTITCPNYALLRL